MKKLFLVLAMSCAVSAMAGDTCPLAPAKPAVTAPAKHGFFHPFTHFFTHAFHHEKKAAAPKK